MPGPYNLRRFKCPVCGRNDFKSSRGLKYHLNRLHPVFDDTTDSSTEPSGSSSIRSNNNPDSSSASHSDTDNDLNGFDPPQAMGPGSDVDGAEGLRADHNDGKLQFLYNADTLFTLFTSI